MDKCEQELLQYKLREMFCKKHHDDCCDVCVVDCCHDKKEKDSICDCCVKPMVKLLKFLEREVYPPQLTQVLLEDGTQFGGDCNTNRCIKILDVNDSVLKIKFDGGIFYVPICKLSRVETTDNDILDADLEEGALRSCGECDCCERTIREKARDFIGEKVSIFANGKPNDYSLREIEKVGLGIVITRFYCTNYPADGDLSKEEAEKPEEIEKPEEQNEEQKHPDERQAYPGRNVYSAYSTCQITGVAHPFFSMM